MGCTLGNGWRGGSHISSLKSGRSVGPIHNSYGGHGASLTACLKVVGGSHQPDRFHYYHYDEVMKKKPGGFSPVIAVDRKAAKPLTPADLRHLPYHHHRAQLAAWPANSVHPNPGVGTGHLPNSGPHGLRPALGRGLLREPRGRWNVRVQFIAGTVDVVRVPRRRDRRR